MRRTPIEIVSYNLRTDSANDDHPWSSRRAGQIELLTDLAPTILGTQEGSIDQLNDLSSGLPAHYQWIGEGRRGAHLDEFAAVFYDSERLGVETYEHCWLSDTPSVAGSTSWGNVLPRMYTAVTFVDRQNIGDRFEVINTHFDHRSEDARLRSADALVERINTSIDRGLPSILMGDFNADADGSAEYLQLRKTPLNDTYLLAGGVPGVTTFNNYAPPSPGPRIDWILTTPQIEVSQAAIWDRQINGTYPSDHFPIGATLHM